MATLYACVQPPPRGSTTPVRIERPTPATAAKSETERLLDEFALMRTLPKEQVAKDYGEAARALTQAPTSSNRIRLAFLLGLPNTNFQDLNRSLALLQEVLKDETVDEAGVRRLGGLLYSQYNRDLRNQETIQALNLRLSDAQKRVEAGSQKQDETVVTLTQKLKEEQKRSETLTAKQEESAQTIGTLAQKLKEEKLRAEQLQQKLDALADIEKSMVERQQQPKPEPNR